MDRTRRVEIFVRTVDAGSFASAAISLDLDPSAVSRAVAELEKQLRVTLFYRTTRRVTLTEDGAEFYRRGKEMLESIAQAEEAFQRTPSRLGGILRVGFAPLAESVLVPALPRFLNGNPELRVEFFTMNYGKQMNAHAADVLFSVRGPQAPGLVATEVLQVKYGIYASPAYLKAAGSPKIPDDLANHRCIGHRPPWLAKPLTDWVFERGTIRKELKVTATLVTDDRAALLSAVLSGVGIARLGCFPPELVNDGRLRQLLPDWTFADRLPLFAVYRRTSRFSPRISAFLNFAFEAFSAFDPQELTVIHSRSSFRKLIR